MKTLRSTISAPLNRTGIVPRQQRGAATLAVVMLLFFVISLTAAYTSRNLIFEQRTSANQYRSTQSLEVAEAGMEWAIAMVNAGRVDDNCQPTTDLTKGSIRQRYLNIHGPNGDLPTFPPGFAESRYKPDNSAPPFFACVFNGASWTCSCPSDLSLDPVLAVPPGTGQFPAFGVRFWDFDSTKPGTVRIEVNGCLSYDLACVTWVNPAPEVNKPAQCQTTLCALVSLFSGVRMPPAAALTVRDSLSGSGLTVTNPVASIGGITVHSGGAISMTPPSSLILGSAPGTPGSVSKVENDSKLFNLPTESSTCTFCMFTSVFGLPPNAYKGQPAVVVIPCSGGCDASTISSRAAENPGRVLWLEGSGGLNLNTSAVIGSATDPVVLIVDGPVTAAAGSTVYGLIFGPSFSLDAGRFIGAVVSSGTVTAAGTAEIAYDADVIGRLKYQTGSFVRVPSSWRDFP